MSISLIIAILVIVALMLFALEVFVTPGIGVSGILGALCALAAIVLTYSEYGFVAAVGSLLGITVVVLLLLWWLSRSKSLESVSLTSTIDSTAATEAQLSVKVGDKGVALTRLALIGNADFEGKTVEVKSDGAFIEEGTPIEVRAVSDALVVVRAIS